MIHNLGVSIYYHFSITIQQYMYNTVKCKLADFYRQTELFSKIAIATFNKH